jgi:hypothetical protein
MGLSSCYTAGSEHAHCCSTGLSFFTAAAIAAASAVTVETQSCYRGVIEGITVVVVVTTKFLYFADFTAASTIAAAKDFAIESFESAVMVFGAIALAGTTTAGCSLQLRPLF